MSQIVTRELILFLTVEGLKAFEALFGTKLKLESEEQGARGRRLRTASSAGQSIVFQRPSRACITFMSTGGYLIGVDAHTKNEGVEYQMTVSCIVAPQGATQGLPPDVECRLLLLSKRFVSIDAFDPKRSGSFTSVDGVVKYLMKASRFASFREDFALMQFFRGDECGDAVPYIAQTGMLDSLLRFELITLPQYEALKRTGNMGDYEETDKQGMQSPFASPPPSPEIVPVVEDVAVEVNLDSVDDVQPTPEEPPSIDAADVQLVATAQPPTRPRSEIEEAQAAAAAAMKVTVEPVVPTASSAQVTVTPPRAGSATKGGRMQLTRRSLKTGEIVGVEESDMAKVPNS